LDDTLIKTREKLSADYFVGIIFPKYRCQSRALIADGFPKEESFSRWQTLRHSAFSLVCIFAVAIKMIWLTDTSSQVRKKWILQEVNSVLKVRTFVKTDCNDSGWKTTG